MIAAPIFPNAPLAAFYLLQRTNSRNTTTQFHRETLLLPSSPLAKMSSRLFDGLVLPASADFHVHLRDGAMLEAVAPTIRQGGVETVFVMVSVAVIC